MPAEVQITKSAAGIGATVQGIPDLRAALQGIVPKLRRQALRNALAAGARVIQREARARAPVLQMSAPYRKAGTVRDAIKVRTSPQAKKAGNVGVFVNVKPAKGAKFRTVSIGLFSRRIKVRRQVAASQRGAKSAVDPYYWRFLEFGTKKMGKRPFLEPAARRLGDALAVFIQKIGPQIQKLNGGKDVQL